MILNHQSIKDANPSLTLLIMKVWPKLILSRPFETDNGRINVSTEVARLKQNAGLFVDSLYGRPNRYVNTVCVYM